MNAASVSSATTRALTPPPIPPDGGTFTHRRLSLHVASGQAPTACGRASHRLTPPPSSPAPGGGLLSPALTTAPARAPLFSGSPGVMPAGWHAWRPAVSADAPTGPRSPTLPTRLLQRASVHAVARYQGCPATSGYDRLIENARAASHDRLLACVWNEPCAGRKQAHSIQRSDTPRKRPTLDGCVALARLIGRVGPALIALDY